MPESYTNLLYHFIFSTKDRRPLITPDYEIRLHDYIGGVLRNLGGISLGLNGTEDHIHLLAKLRPDRAVSDVIRDLKSNSSGWLHDIFPPLHDFSWQRGYGGFSVSYSNVEEVKSTSLIKKIITRRFPSAMSSFNSCRPTKLSST